MPKEDIAVTRALRQAKLLLDGESYISTDGHLIFFGRDKSRIRPLIFKRYKNKCCVCAHPLGEDALPFSDYCGAWHHPGPCSCVGCTDLRCDATTGRPCHAHRVAGSDFNREKGGTHAS
jgi:hypothetical protein